jgi:hydrogenase nickel incorporation protein HypA/HybF
MHEYSIASEIWASVKKASEEHGGGRVVSISLELGALNLIEEDQLTFWLEALAERDGSPGVQVKVTTLPVRLRCRQCGGETVIGDAGEPAEGLPYAAAALACGECGSRNVEFAGGREIRVVSAEVAESDPDQGAQPRQRPAT